MTRGREQAFRAEQLDIAGVGEGQAVLDVGCGTGTLAIAAARRVGPRGSAIGVDPSPEMVARATGKARRAGVAVTFLPGAAQALPVADGASTSCCAPSSSTSCRATGCTRRSPSSDAC